MDIFIKLLPFFVIALIVVVVVVEGFSKLIRKGADVISNKDEYLNRFDDIADNIKQNMSNRNVIGGIVFIILGIIIFCFDTGRYIKFGGDFYTEIYQAVTNIAIIIKFSFGFLLIGLGVDRLTRK